MKNFKKLPSGIEYRGLSGISSECKDAVIQLLYSEKQITNVKIITCKNRHSLLLSINDYDTVAIKSGFSSGYGGEGPSTFSYVLALLDFHGVQIDEYGVGKYFFDRLEESRLTIGDLDQIKEARPIRPSRWRDYVLDDDWDDKKASALWKKFPLVIPFSIIDERIADLALKFIERPDEILLSGYRRLEDIVRQRTGLSEHGAKLFQEAFLTEPPKLSWPIVDKTERRGRGMLFSAAYMAHRNPRAHKEPEKYDDHQLTEFLLLNHLYLLEKEAKEFVPLEAKDSVLGEKQ